MTHPDKLLVEAVKARLAPLMVSAMPYDGGKVYPTESHLTAIAEAAIEAVNSYKHTLPEMTLEQKRDDHVNWTRHAFGDKAAGKVQEIYNYGIAAKPTKA